MQDCPDRQTLESLLADLLPDVERGPIEMHIESCVDCQSKLERMTTDHATGPGTCQATVQSHWQAIADHMVVTLQREISQDTSREVPNRAPQIKGYRVIRLLGRGGMGAVYEAEHLNLRRLVAIKLLPELAQASPQRRERFQREMRAIGQLDHPGIVKAFDAAEVDGMQYLVMERIYGVTVAELVHRQGALSICNACEIIRQAATALQHAHDRSLIHRDIKPSNMMLTDGGSVKILDLGMARLTDSDESSSELTSSGQIMGTIDYMSPEQATGCGEISAATDIYSLGASLYRLLTGHCVFHGEAFGSTLKKLSAIAHEEPVPLSDMRTDVPKELCGIVMQMMAKDPTQRLADAETVVRAMTPFCKGNKLVPLIQPAYGDADNERDATTDTRSKLSSEVITETIDGHHSDIGITCNVGDVARPNPETPRRATTSQANSSSRGKGNHRAIVLATTASLFLLGYVVVTLLGVFEIHTDQGVLVIKSIGTDFKTLLAGKVVTIKNMQTGQQHEIYLSSEESQRALDSGSYVMLKTASGIETLTDHFRIRSGETQEIEVWWNPARPIESATESAHTSPEMPGTGDPHGSQSIAPPDPGTPREVAERIFAIGGKLVVRGLSQTFQSVTELPPGKNWTIGEIVFEGSGVTNDDMKTLARLSTPTKLVLRRTNVDGDGLAHLRNSRITQLAWVQLIDDSLLDQIAQLTQLEGLDLEAVDSNTRGSLSPMRRLERLRAVSLNGIDLTNSDFEHLKQCEELEHLFVQAAGLNDDSMAIIASYPKLQSLALSGNRCTVNGLMHLTNAKELKSLFLNESNVTAADIDSLRKAFQNRIEIRVAD